MADRKKDPGGVGYQIEAPSPVPGERCDMDIMLNLPKPLNLEEKKYLLSVERGDLANVRRLVDYILDRSISYAKQKRELSVKKSISPQKNQINSVTKIEIFV